jgi:hypothetical protein
MIPTGDEAIQVGLGAAIFLSLEDYHLPRQYGETCAQS